MGGERGTLYVRSMSYRCHGGLIDQVYSIHFTNLFHYICRLIWSESKTLQCESDGRLRKFGQKVAIEAVPVMACVCVCLLFKDNLDANHATQDKVTRTEKSCKKNFFFHFFCQLMGRLSYASRTLKKREVLPMTGKYLAIGFHRRCSTKVS